MRVGELWIQKRRVEKTIQSKEYMKKMWKTTL